jgi:hypothetical protein
MEVQRIEETVEAGFDMAAAIRGMSGVRPAAAIISSHANADSSEIRD